VGTKRNNISVGPTTWPSLARISHQCLSRVDSGPRLWHLVGIFGGGVP
jgi:hypothetical protein